MIPPCAGTIPMVASVLALVLAGCASPSAEPPAREPHVSTDQRPDTPRSAASEASALELPGPAVMFPAVNVLDLKATEAFYVDVMGMKVTLRVGEEGDEVQEVTLNFSGEIYSPEASLVLNYVASRTEPYVFDAFSRIAFRVTDVDALVERIRAAGHEILEEPRLIEVEGSRLKLAFVEDPNGARLELIQTVVPSDATQVTH